MRGEGPDVLETYVRSFVIPLFLLEKIKKQGSLFMLYYTYSGGVCRTVLLILSNIVKKGDGI